MSDKFYPFEAGPLIKISKTIKDHSLKCDFYHKLFPWKSVGLWEKYRNTTTDSSHLAKILWKIGSNNISLKDIIQITLIPQEHINPIDALTHIYIFLHLDLSITDRFHKTSFLIDDWFDLDNSSWETTI